MYITKQKGRDMANIRKAIADIAVANGYEGGEPQTIISALDALTDTLAGDDEDGGGSVGEAVRALAPYVGEVPSGTITITENGTDIDVASYAKADVSVSGGGGSYGELVEACAYLSESAPVIGTSTGSVPDANARVILSGTTVIAMSEAIVGAASGAKVGFSASASDTVNGLYIITIDAEGHYGDEIATVREITGSDIAVTELTFVGQTVYCIALTLPEMQEGEYLWIHYTSSD